MVDCRLEDRLDSRNALDLDLAHRLCELRRTLADSSRASIFNAEVIVYSCKVGSERNVIGSQIYQAVDPRSRIIACYQNLIATVSRLGAPVPSDLTARELERAIRFTFTLKGSGTSELTQLFEEARYSLHEIRDEDAAKAHNYLESIAGELKTSIPN